MKVILSRKGFDSQYGGYPSPILPDGRMVSLPIPSNKDNFHYSDLKFENKTYYDLMKELGIKEIILKKSCHIDPDIYLNIIKRESNWMPLFGQRGAAQGHLHNQKISEDDLFLFFGTFRKTIIKNGKLEFDSQDKEKHMIFGYLQIGKIIRTEEDLEEWMKYHPHCNYEEKWSKKNTLYAARKNLSWNSNLPGAGIFKYNKNLVLTAEGHLKSIWDIPILKGKKISYHTQNSWQNGLLKTVGRGQEFVIEEDKEVEVWAKELIEESDLI